MQGDEVFNFVQREVPPMLEDAFNRNGKTPDDFVTIAKTPKKVTLTDALMETLSIIAYKQPITRLDVERIRGVNSDHAVNRLVEFGLVQELGRLDAPGRPMLFGTTEEFLRSFGLQSMEDLPKLDPVEIEEWKIQAEEEATETLRSEEDDI